MKVWTNEKQNTMYYQSESDNIVDYIVANGLDLDDFHFLFDDGYNKYNVKN